MKTGIMILLLFPSFFCWGQQWFSENEFLSVVRKYHPVARQAQLNISIAKAEVLKNRGAFDPSIQNTVELKDFDGIQYYDQQQHQLKIPTWYGIDLFAGTESINGARTNPEETKGTIAYAGFSVPLLQNLLLDKRRAALKQSKLLVQQSEAEQKVIVNDLLLEAMNAYWNWWQHYQLYQLADSILQNATTRFSMIKTAWQLGDRPAIDTVEALTQVQTLAFQKNVVYTDFVKSGLELSAYLWKEDGNYYDLPNDVMPSPTVAAENFSLNDLLTQAYNHPVLIQYGYKLSSLAIERKLKFQSLLPKADLKYNQLVRGNNFTKTMNAAWFQNNYRFGINVSMPIRLSEARAEIKQANLKIKNVEWERIQKTVQLQTKLRQYYAELLQTSEQIKLQNALVENYAALQRAEQVRFSNGESSLFLINSREQKTIEGIQKLIEVKTKNLKSITALKWAAGIL